MILKYRDSGAWGYIDNVRQVGHRMNFFPEYCISEYDKQIKEGKRSDIIGENWAEEVIKNNKCFLICSENIEEELEGNGHTQNLLRDDLIDGNCPISTILLYLNDHKEYDHVIIITNQETYLLNDNGKTIERLT